MSDPALDHTWEPDEGESLAAAVYKIRRDLHESLATLGYEASKVGERIDLDLIGIEAIIRGKEQGGPGWVDWCLNTANYPPADE